MTKRKKKKKSSIWRLEKSSLWVQWFHISLNPWNSGKLKSYSPFHLVFLIVPYLLSTCLCTGTTFSKPVSVSIISKFSAFFSLTKHRTASRDMYGNMLHSYCYTPTWKCILLENAPQKIKVSLNLQKKPAELRKSWFVAGNFCFLRKILKENLKRKVLYRKKAMRILST